MPRPPATRRPASRSRETIHRAAIDALTAAVASVLQFAQPADRALSAWFRNHPRLGQRERAWIAEAVFALLRHLRSISAVANTRHPRPLALATLTRLRDTPIEALQDAVSAADFEWLRRVSAAPVPDDPATRAELPDWLWTRLAAAYDATTRDAIARGLLVPAPLDLRVNPLRIRREDAIARLVADGIACEPTGLSPIGIRLRAKPAIQTHPLFVSGDIEVQDEGSQLVCMLVAPKRGEMVVDFCAGAGGKTLLLGAMMRSQGRLYAFDVSEARLRRMRPRVARSGLSNVQPTLISGERDERVKRLAGKIDRVLVDAPCTGTGTLRRNPDLKWRQDERALAELSAKQASILASAATLLKPGGRLVYATCSLLPEENEAVVDAFLASHPGFGEVHAAAELARQGVHLPREHGPRLRLFPHCHGCDGFFAAAMERSTRRAERPSIPTLPALPGTK